MFYLKFGRSLGSNIIFYGRVCLCRLYHMRHGHRLVFQLIYANPMPTKNSCDLK